MERTAEFDCLGECEGTAILDLCGVCNGDNSTCLDCLYGVLMAMPWLIVR